MATIYNEDGKVIYESPSAKEERIKLESKPKKKKLTKGAK